MSHILISIAWVVLHDIPMLNNPWAAHGVSLHASIHCQLACPTNAGLVPSPSQLGVGREEGLETASWA